MGEDRTAILGIAGIAISTENAESMRSFYRDVLGFTPHSVRPDGAQFKWGDVRLTIGSHSLVHRRTSEPYRIMINLLVADIHAVYDRLRAKGVEFIRTPGRERWGWLATFQDPDGNTLQLLQNDPRQAQ
ncbi:MAG: VOC family protein [Chloroflexi bacterium]|nr:VOC family protein [Chloroflexota bacterium]